jgi:transposase
MKQLDVAQQVQVNRHVVVLWERRFRVEGIGGLQESKRSGRKPTIDPQIKAGSSLKPLGLRWTPFFGPPLLLSFGKLEVTM